MKPLTDEELRNELRANGIEPGPITPATREVYERKLQRLINDVKAGTKSKPPSRTLHVPKTEPMKQEEKPIRPAARISIGSTAVVSTSRFSPPEPVFGPDYRDRSLNDSQENPGHTPIPGIRAPLRTVNNDDLYSSTTPEEPELHYRSKLSSHENSPHNLYQYQRRPAYSSTPRHSLSRDKQDSTEQPDRSFWGSWFRRSFNASDVLSDEAYMPSDEVVFRASPSHPTNRSRMDDETTDRSSFARFFSYSFGNQIPNVILFCVIVLLVVIGLSYILLRDKHTNVGKIADIQKVVCHSVSTELTKSQCVSSQNLPTVLKIAHTLFDILSRFSGEHICGESVESPRMEVETAKRLVKNAFNSLSTRSVSPFQVDDLWDNVLMLITEVGRKHLEIAAYDMDGQSPLSYHDVSELESLRPYIPGKCRLYLFFNSLLHFLRNLFWLIIILCAVGFVSFIFYRAKQSQLNRTKYRNRRVQEIVREVSGILQQQMHLSQGNRSEPPHVPVTVLKESLRRTNSDLEDLWPEVEQHVHLVERNIAVSDWRGLGETWQWHAGSGWQGSAISRVSQHLPFKVPPTECLKVRNMFKADSPDTNPRRLKQELLHRISDCGDILHIGFDSVDGQGLVYIKCASPAVAGRVFESINANYFDGHMLTVKFLRPVKYHMRFPEAADRYLPLSTADLE